MNDIEESESYPTTSNLTKLGISAIGCFAGGIFLFILQMVSRFRIVGLIAGAIICIIGLASLRSRDPADRKPGAVITAAGVLTILSKTTIPLLNAAAGTLMSIGGIGLLAMGIMNGLKFFIGLKKRS